MTFHNLGASTVGGIQITESSIRAAIARAAAAVGVSPRFDAGGNPVFPNGTIEAWSRHVDGLIAPRLREDGLSADVMETARRSDALSPGPSGFPYDFTFVHSEILREARPQMSGLMMAPADGTVPLGAKDHVMRRRVTAGKARWHRQGEGVPLTSSGDIEERFRTGIAVCGVEVPYFDSLSANFAGSTVYRDRAEAAVLAVWEFLNDVSLYGDTSKLIYGMLTYPHLSKMVIGTEFSSASSGVTIHRALSNAVNFPKDTSKGLFRPNRMGVTPAMHSFLHTEPYDSSSGGTTTIAEQFLKTQSPTTGIREIEIIHELEAAAMTAAGVGNPTGYEGIYLWNDSRMSVRHIVPQAPVFLPVFQQDPFTTVQVCFAQTGGIVMPDAASQALLFVSRG